MHTNISLEPTLNEKSTGRLAVSWTDVDGDPVVPQSVSYTVHCLTTDTQVVGDTAVTPAASISIHLGVTANTIQAPDLASEMRRVTVKAAFGPDDQVNDQFDYRLINLSYVV